MEIDTKEYLPQSILNLQNKIPDGDLISSKWDVNEPSEIKKLLIIFSTPRSGSTFLCHKLLQEKLCIAHEYYQPYQYLPIAAKRWDCISNKNTIDIGKYTDKLIEKRTTDNNVLGVNLHGHHIEIFEKIVNKFSDIDIEYIHLKRKDLLGQAISYEIAAQGESWSSEFSTTKKTKFLKRNIEKKIERLQKQNELIQKYIKDKNITAHSFYFEEFTHDPKKHLDQLSYKKRFKENYETLEIKRQSNSLNKRWRSLYDSNPIFRKFRLLLGI